MHNSPAQIYMLSHVVGPNVFFHELNLCSRPYIVYANSRGSGETVHVHSLAGAFAGRVCNKFRNLMNQLIFIHI